MSAFVFTRLLEQGEHSDVDFLVHGQKFAAHRCILSARSDYFKEMFETKWEGKNLITLKHPLVGMHLEIVIYIHLFTRYCHIVLESTSGSSRIKSVLISA